MMILWSNRQSQLSRRPNDQEVRALFELEFSLFCFNRYFPWASMVQDFQHHGQISTQKLTPWVAIFIMCVYPPCNYPKSIWDLECVFNASLNFCALWQYQRVSQILYLSKGWYCWQQGDSVIRDIAECYWVHLVVLLDMKNQSENDEDI